MNAIIGAPSAGPAVPTPADRATAVVSMVMFVLKCFARFSIPSVARVCFFVKN